MDVIGFQLEEALLMLEKASIKIAKIQPIELPENVKMKLSLSENSRQVLYVGNQKFLEEDKEVILFVTPNPIKEFNGKG